MGSPYHISDAAFRHFPYDHSSAEYEALSTITESLEHPQRTILSTFVQHAVDTRLASQFLLDEVFSRGKASVLEILADWITLIKKVRPVICTDLSHPLKQAVWRRDGGQCCLSKVRVGKSFTAWVYIVPPSLFEDCGTTSNEQVYKLLSIFIGESRLNNLRALPDRNSPSVDPCSQVIILSPSVFEHFRNGRISLKGGFAAASQDSVRLYPRLHNYSKVNELIPFIYVERPQFVTWENKASSPVSLPHAHLSDVHHRFADAMAWLDVVEYMKQKRSTLSTDEVRNKLSSDKKLPAKKTWISRHILNLWTLLPAAIRAFTYKRLASIACRFDGHTGSDRTFRLPFNLYLRMAGSDWAPKYEAESQALQLVEKHTTIPARRALDVIKHSSSPFLLMTGLPGTPVRLMLPTMTDKQVVALIRDLKVYVAELRHIPNKTGSGFEICNPLGGGILDWRIANSQREELRFRDEAEFNQFLTHDLPLTEDMLTQSSKAHSIRHDIVFTHADLNMRNILVDEERKISV
ncbi:hypothetical protein CC86DRAFT_430713 [Ophiobolus disseminans]|uniref:Aminoglycoside phosphotransferase domain-containing protein n=1 Tax=Ophiobolus disseminans TaxID=1469910 RepID=A0A6A7ACV5_9PLEO|nr:hypothetical protein CC86DRAFT_430713 [Ophiobolus disseminans]